MRVLTGPDHTTVCAALTGALLAGLSCAAPRPAAATESQLSDWNVTGWSAQSRAACGVALTKAGYLGSEMPQPEADFDMLARGLALDALSRSAEPQLNRDAWDSPVMNLRNDAFMMMVLECGDLFVAALAQGRIPNGVIQAARSEARAYQAANGLTGQGGD